MKFGSACAVGVTSIDTKVGREWDMVPNGGDLQPGIDVRAALLQRANGRECTIRSALPKKG